MSYRVWTVERRFEYIGRAHYRLAKKDEVSLKTKPRKVGQCSLKYPPAASSVLGRPP